MSLLDRRTLPLVDPDALPRWVIGASGKYWLRTDGIHFAERTRADYIAATGDLCGGRGNGCDICREES